MKGRARNSLSGVLAGAMQIPRDVVRGNVLVSMEGQERVLIENFKGISSCTQEEIRLVARKNKICVIGKHLKIDSYTKEEIEISGQIQRLEYI